MASKSKTNTTVKTFSSDDEVHCNLCKMKIDTESEEFAELIHYQPLKYILSRAYYHVTCFRDRYFVNRNIEDEANELIGATRKVINKLTRMSDK